VDGGFPVDNRCPTWVDPDERVQERFEVMQANTDLFQIVFCGATRAPTWMSRTIMCSLHPQGHHCEQRQKRYEHEPAHLTPLPRLNVTSVGRVDRLSA
jgi:hypothetical protein